MKQSILGQGCTIDEIQVSVVGGLSRVSGSGGITEEFMKKVDVSRTSSLRLPSNLSTLAGFTKVIMDQFSQVVSSFKVEPRNIIKATDRGD